MWVLYTASQQIIMQEINPFAVKLSYPKRHKTFLCNIFLTWHQLWEYLESGTRKNNLIVSWQWERHSQYDNFNISWSTRKYGFFRKYGKFIFKRTSWTDLSDLFEEYGTLESLIAFNKPSSLVILTLSVHVMPVILMRIQSHVISFHLGDWVSTC